VYGKIKMNRKGDIMRNPFRPLNETELRSNPEYKEAVEFVKTYEPTKGRTYQWAYDNVMHAFDQATDTINILDRKAENMVKYIVPSTGLLGIALAWLAISLRSSMWPALLIGTGIVLLSVSMISSLLCISPHRFPFPPSIRGALLECADNPKYDSEQAMAKFAAALDRTTVGRIIVADFKGKYVRFAYKSFALSLVPILAGLSWVIVNWARSCNVLP
jgi:hypothetical protein